LEKASTLRAPSILGNQPFFRFRGNEFWNYHKKRLAELGYPLKQFALLKAAVVTAVEKSV
jgi:hypothetical protein